MVRIYIRERPGQFTQNPQDPHNLIVSSTEVPENQIPSFLVEGTEENNLLKQDVALRRNLQNQDIDMKRINQLYENAEDTMNNARNRSVLDRVLQFSLLGPSSILMNTISSVGHHFVDTDDELQTIVDPRGRFEELERKRAIKKFIQKYHRPPQSEEDWKKVDQIQNSLMNKFMSFQHLYSDILVSAPDLLDKDFITNYDKINNFSKVQKPLRKIDQIERNLFKNKQNVDFSKFDLFDKDSDLIKKAENEMKNEDTLKKIAEGTTVAGAVLGGSIALSKLLNAGGGVLTDIPDQPEIKEILSEKVSNLKKKVSSFSSSLMKKLRELDTRVSSILRKVQKFKKNKKYRNIVNKIIRLSEKYERMREQGADYDDLLNIVQEIEDLYNQIVFDSLSDFSSDFDNMMNDVEKSLDFNFNWG